MKQELIFVGNEHGKLIEFRNIVQQVGFSFHIIVMLKLFVFGLNFSIGPLHTFVSTYLNSS